MYKQLRFLTTMLLLAVCCGTWADPVTGTITFGTNNVAINKSVVEATDNLDNSWRITTIGTTSYTANTDYYQVGSSKSPATSICFQLNLSASQTITSIEAKFGGFSGTAGTVTMKIGTDVSNNTQVGTGSLNEANDVTVSSTSQGTGSYIEVEITGISKGVKCYYISYTYETSGGSTETAVATETRINDTGITNTDFGTSTAAGTLSANVIANGEAVPGATVTWESSNENVATIASDGTVTLVGAGTTTITASYAGVENQYQASSATYTLTVTDSSDLSDNFTWDLSTNSYQGTPDENEISWMHSAATMTNEKGSSSQGVNSYIPTARTSTRFYTGQILTITPNAGYSIKKVEFTATTEGYASVLAGSSWTNATASAISTTVTVTPTNGAIAFSTTIGGTCGFTAVKVYYEQLPAHNVTFSINGETSTDEFVEGSSINFPTVEAINGYNHVGWLTSEITGTQADAPQTLVTSATMGSGDITYYAVFAQGSSSSEAVSTTISHATSGVPTSYGTANTFTEYTLEGINFKIQQMYKNGEKLQWRAAGNNSGTGTMYNVDALNKIQSIVLTYHADDSNKNFTVHVGNEANPTAGTSITPAANENVYTFDCSAYNASYFVLTNGSGAGYLTSIVINYLHETSNFSNYCTTIPTPSITVADATVSVTAEGDVDTRAITYEYLDITDATDFAVFFYDSDDNQLRGEDEPDWIEVEVAEENGSYMISYLVNANTSAERTAYFKVAAVEGEDFIFSNLVTVTQAAGPSATATIAEACTDGKGKYYSTYSNTSAFILPEGVTASEISVIDGELLVENYAAGAVVPANTGVMISSETAGEKTFYLTTGGTSVLGSSNMLHATGNGITAAEMAPADAPDCLYYRLTMHNGTTIGFWWGAPDGAAFSVGANKAYLAVPANQAKDGFAFGNDGDATSISTIDNGQLTMENAYNLQGQKVGSAYKGIVIVNGKARINK